MIFAAFGTSLPFPRLLKRMDELAKEIPEEILVQSGTTELPVHFCKTFAYAPSLQEYFQQARIVICHAGLGIQLELMRMKKPFIAVPRLFRYGEHADDHQVETCEMFSKKYGVHYLLDVAELTPELLMEYNKIIPYTGDSLQMFRKNIHPVLLGKSHS